MKDRILILGAGHAQIDLIERCRALGLEVHGVSYCGADPGVALLDHFEPINITDTDGVEAYILRNRINYITSVGSDIAMPALCEAARRTGLRCFISPQAAKTCTSKSLMRQALQGSPYQMEHVVCRRIADVQSVSFYPVMMKPADSQGQRGVRMCRDEEEVRRCFAQSMAFSRCGEVILERFIPGDEVSVNAYMIDGRLAFFMLSDRESFSEYPGGIVRGHRLPSQYAGTKTEERILALVNEAAERLGLRNGPVYVQIMVCDGWPYLLEAAPRLDGCHMWRLILLYTGIDLLGVMLEHLLTGQARLPRWTPLVRAARTEFICRAPGTVFLEETEESQAAIRVSYYRKGETVRRVNGYMEKCGYRMTVDKLRVGLIGGSGLIGRSFHRLYRHEFDLTDISRSAMGADAYSREKMTASLSICDAAVILAGQKVCNAANTDYGVNVRIACEAMEACRCVGVKRVVLLSSRCVYDHSAPVPFSEDAPILPINEYAESKAQAEALCLKLGKAYGIRVIVLRLAQVLSEENAHTAFGVFLRRALGGMDLEVYGRTSGVRDYVCMEDACSGIRCALLAQGAAGIYNIGSGVPVSIDDLARAVVKATQADVKIVFREDLPQDGLNVVLDIGRARRELNYVPRYGLEEAAKACALRMMQKMNGEA